MSKDNFAFLEGDAPAVAKRLLGCHIVRTIDGQKVIGRIVETEAYHQTDAASHSYKGRTPRTDIMFGPPGFAYIYFTYGMHYCMNVVTGPESEGSAVLIRALEPVSGEDIMMRYRRRFAGNMLTNGPAKLCQALAIDRHLNGHDLRQEPLQLRIMPSVTAANIHCTTRIGITRDVNRPWRFYIKDSAAVSRR